MKKNIAIVLCGGKGSRISEITKIIPKSLIKINKKPIIWFVISYLINSGIKKIILPLGYKGNQIRNYIKKEFQHHLEKIDLIDTGRDTEIFERIYKVKNLLSGYDNFLILNSDTVFDLNLKKFINFHNKNNFNITLSGIKMKSSWGSIIRKKNSIKLYKFIKNEVIDMYQLKGFNKYEAFRNTGISIMKVKILKTIKIKKKLDFESFFFNKIDDIGSFIFDGFWYPIETYKDYSQLKNDTILKNRVKNLIDKING